MFQKLERLLGLSSGKQDKTTIIRLAMAALKAEKILKQGKSMSLHVGEF